MSHPGYDESSNPLPGEPVETAYSGKTDQVPTSLPAPQPAPQQQPAWTPPPVYAPTYPPTAYPPTYNPTAAFQPVPAPPTYDPTVMAQQYSAPPTSGPYGYPGPPMGGGPGLMPRKRSGAVVTLAILTAVFLAASGVLGALFVVKTKQTNDLRATVAAEQAKNAGLAKDLDNARRDLDDSQGQTEEMASQKKAIADCMNAIFDVSDALDASEGQVTPDILAKRSDLERKCDAAEKFL
jgi:hypothetical protein